MKNKKKEKNDMENIHSIIIIKKGDKYLNYFDDRWGMYLFPNIKGNNIEIIKDKYGTDDVKLLFDKVHDKYSVSHDEVRRYHHYFYEVNTEVDGEYFSLDELLKNPKIKENNEDIIKYIDEFYSNM